MSWRIFSRLASSASSTLSVMSPLAWPVITRGPPGGERRKSNITPRSGSSLDLRLHRQAERRATATTRRRLATSIARPVAPVVRVVEVRDRAIEPAGDAEVERIVGRQQPVASRRRVEVRAALVLVRTRRARASDRANCRRRAGRPANARAGNRAATCSSGTANCGRRCGCRSGSGRRASGGERPRRVPSTRWTSLARRRRTGSSSTGPGPARCRAKSATCSCSSARRHLRASPSRCSASGP